MHGVVETHTPITYQDWSVDSGADVSVPVAAGLTTLVYVFKGSVQLGEQGKTIADGQLAILGEGDALRIRGGPGRFLLLAGAPLHEPVARYGPFVMNTRQELLQAFEDYQSGRMGEIVRTAQVG